MSTPRSPSAARSPRWSPTPSPSPWRAPSLHTATALPPTGEPGPARFAAALRVGRILFSLILCLAAAFFVWKTIAWHWMYDESIMHYINFLMDHGQAPYRDIIDPNMPGSYFIDRWAIAVFGWGDLGWRLYEFSLLAVLTASMIVIARPYDWFAGLFAGILFIFTHAIDGPFDTTQRDEIMTVLIMAGYALLFLALRRRSPLLMLPFGFLVGLAASLKPTAVPLGLVLLFLAAIALSKRKVPATPYLGYGLAGLGAAFLLTLGFLLEYHALSAFLVISRRLLPYYARVGNMGFVELSQHFFYARTITLLLPFAIILTVANTDTKDWERWALALGVAFGAVSFYVQQKGFFHHRYPFLAFFFLWTGIECVRALRQPQRWRRTVGLAGLAAGTLYLVPLYAARLNALPSTIELPHALERDLTRLGGTALQNQVQCLDMVSGCLDALYHLGLVQSTGLIGDYMLFQPRGAAPDLEDRRLFWNAIQAHPPRVIVLNNMWLREPSSFDKLAQWPEFARYLDTAYTLDVTRDMGPNEVMGYRVYLLKPVPSQP